MSETRLRRTLLPRAYTHTQQPTQPTQPSTQSPPNQNSRSPRLLRRGRTVLRKVGFTGSREKIARHNRDRFTHSTAQTTDNRKVKIHDHKENVEKKKKELPSSNTANSQQNESGNLNLSQDLSSRSDALLSGSQSSQQPDHKKVDEHNENPAPDTPDRPEEAVQKSSTDSKSMSGSNLRPSNTNTTTAINKTNTKSTMENQIEVQTSDKTNENKDQSVQDKKKSTDSHESPRESFGEEYQASLTQVQRTGFVERSVAAAVISAARQRGIARKSKQQSTSIPPHHRLHGGFCNPWDSAMKETISRPRGGAGSRTFFHKVAKDRRPLDEELASLLLLAEKPDFSAAEEVLKKDKHALVSFWLGHCTFLLRARGLTVLTDPVWSPRLGPLGPKRLIPPPCEISELPSVIDAVILSSACYDHYDKNAIQALSGKVSKWLVPLGLKQILVGIGIDENKIVELDWWQETHVKETMFVCTPSQHSSIREDALWCSWVAQTPYHRFFFCGATGYRSVERSARDVDAYDGRQYFGGPCCPVFKEIRRKYGSFDTAMLPIGGFKPRLLMSGVQGDAIDMLFIHRDLGAKRSIAHRWGTYALNEEGLLDSVRTLENGLMTGPVAEHEFTYLKHGRLHET